MLKKLLIHLLRAKNKPKISSEHNLKFTSALILPVDVLPEVDVLEKVIELGGACAVVVLEELGIEDVVLELDEAIKKKIVS